MISATSLSVSLRDFSMSCVFVSIAPVCQTSGISYVLVGLRECVCCHDESGDVIDVFLRGFGKANEVWKEMRARHREDFDASW